MSLARKGKGPRRDILEQRERARKALAKAEMGSTGTVTTADPLVIARPKAIEKVSACTLLEPMRRTRRRALRTAKKKGSPGTRAKAQLTMDAWWLGSMNALTESQEFVGLTLRLTRVRETGLQVWQSPTLVVPQKLLRTRVGSRRNSIMRPSSLGRRMKVS